MATNIPYQYLDVPHCVGGKFNQFPQHKNSLYAPDHQTYRMVHHGSSMFITVEVPLPA